MPDEDTPAKRYAREIKETEIGGTAGQEHDALLQRTLGRREGLEVATGLDARHAPVVVGGSSDAQTRERELEDSATNREINEKKLARHGNVSDAVRRESDGAENPTPGALRDE